MGQHSIAFYDLDQPIVEAGESMQFVVKQFFAQGLSGQEIAERAELSVEYVKSCVELE